MKNLTDMYDSMTNIDKLIVDQLFISLINNRNYNEYQNKCIDFNLKYNGKMCPKISDIKIDEEIMNSDLSQYLMCYSKKYQSNKELMLFDPITIELLNNNDLYNKYVRPIIILGPKECFKQIENHNREAIFEHLERKCYANYDNPYYIKLMTFVFNLYVSKKDSLSINQIEQIVKFFIKKEANDLHLNIDFELIKITDYFKKLLNKKERKYALNKIMEYDVTYAYHSKLFDGYSMVSLNISNYTKYYIDSRWTFHRILKTIYHECRHAIQCSEKFPSLYNMNEREQAILKYDYPYYTKYHDYFEMEVDANIYGLEAREFILEQYFPNFEKSPSDDEQKLICITNKYQNKFEIEKKIDDVLLNNCHYLNDKYELQKEYFFDGYPKGIMDILRQRSNINDLSEITIYNEMIIRSLNRMNDAELFEKLSFIKDSCPYYLPYIEEAIKDKISEISKVYSSINYLYQKQKINSKEMNKYQSKVNDYSTRMYYYLNQFTLINQIGVAKR